MSDADAAFRLQVLYEIERRLIEMTELAPAGDVEINRDPLPYWRSPEPPKED